MVAFAASGQGRVEGLEQLAALEGLTRAAGAGGLVGRSGITAFQEPSAGCLRASASRCLIMPAEWRAGGRNGGAAFQLGNRSRPGPGQNNATERPT